MLRAKRPRTAEPEPAPEPVQTTRATLIWATKLDGDPKTWLAGADLEQEATAAFGLLNRILHFQRVAAADPATPDVSREQAIVIRVGYGAGEDVAEGRWAQAKVLPTAAPAVRERRAAALRPQERLAALMGGRDAALACEALLLRCRSDVDGERWREAALQLRVAFEAALAELEPWASRGGLAERLTELREFRGRVGDAANMALTGGLDDASIDDVVHVLTRVEAALRARSAAGFD